MISQKEYEKRRNQLATQLPSNSIAIIPGAEETIRNGDVHYNFRQASDFYYFTGFNEPQCLLLISKEGNYLFNRPSCPEEEQWTGKRLGQIAAPAALGITKAYSITDLELELPQLLTGKTTLYYSINRSEKWDKLILSSIQTLKLKARKGAEAPTSICDLDAIVGEMRLIKSDEEIRLLREVARISVEAHKRAMRACKSLKFEYQLEAELRYALISQGCRNLAYESIVGSGANSCVLHYSDNNQPLNSGDLVLIDAGGELDNYAADITRTFPVNGQFSPPQKAIYELVLKAQKAGISCVIPGTSWDKIQQTIISVITKGLRDLGILQGNVEDLIKKEAYKPFYMHSSGHWLGLDVHDVGSYKIKQSWRALKPGMVLTVEPGIYISEGMQGVDPCFWNIGVRIEDDILVTESGCDNLTADLPVEVADIEALMRE
jgi:Xaa-Pro aminopeptidase